MSWVTAGIAGASAIGSIFGKKGGSSKKTSEPKWLQDSEHNLVDRATELADRPYTPYEDQRVAGLSQNERGASLLARGGSEPAREAYGKSSSMLDGLQDYSSSNLAKYQSPYIEGVLQPQLREANLAYERGKTSLLNSKAGAFGGDRVSLEASALDRNHLQGIADTTNRVYSDSFQNAQNAFFKDNDRKIAASEAYSRVGGDLSSLNRSEIQDLMATGGIERVVQQAGLDFNFDQFKEARDWDVNNLDPLIKAITASKGGNSTTTDSGGGRGALGQVLGAAATIAGAYFGSKSGNDSPSPAPGSGSSKPKA